MHLTTESNILQTLGGFHVRQHGWAEWRAAGVLPNTALTWTRRSGTASCLKATGTMVLEKGEPEGRQLISNVRDGMEVAPEEDKLCAGTSTDGSPQGFISLS